MNIQILTVLRDNPNKHSFKNESISIDEIGELEQLYNSGNAFPKALRELLFLAGAYCIVLDYGLTQTQQEMQQKARSRLVANNRVISRPYFVIDVYNAGDQFLFVYLDEGVDDPIVYEAYLPNDSNEERNWLHSLELSLSAYISKGIDRIKQGYNPF